jgi:prepilin-type N-terminal cleavage/methylation domain-containing protein
MILEPEGTVVGRPYRRKPVLTRSARFRGAIAEVGPATAGFTLSEVIVVVFVIALLATITARQVLFSVEQADLAQTYVELRGIQAAMWHESNDGENFARAEQRWGDRFRSSFHGSYVVLVNHAGGGHFGEGVDARVGAAAVGESGNSRPGFIVVCPRRFEGLAEYVYIEDEGPPQLVTGPNNDPGYLRYLGWKREGSDTAYASGTTETASSFWTGSYSPRARRSAEANAAARGSGGPGRAIGVAPASERGTGNTGSSTSSRIPD